MKKTAFTLIFLIILYSIFAKEYVTVYNNNFALIKSQFDIKLEKGLQNYLYEDIPSQIETNSVIFKSLNNKVILFNQNYEYDLANTESIMKKYLNQSISFTTNDNKVRSGILQFFSSGDMGIIDPISKELTIYDITKLNNLKLQSLPDNFYLKPTLRWELQSPSRDEYPIELSYITKGLSWFVTYNAVFKQGKIDIIAWVTLNNRSGKAYEDVNLKLMAGNVNKVITPYQSIKKAMATTSSMDSSVPQFDEKSFADYHLYTLDQSISIANNQEKLIQLFPLKTVNARKFYSFNVFGFQDIDQNIEFYNTKSSGLGIPLPNGIIKMYQQDSDQNMEFIGENSVKHTAIDQRINLVIGKAFDIVKEVKVLSDQNSSNIGTKINEKEISVRIENKKNESADIEVYHSFNGNTKIEDNDIPFITENAYKICFKLKLQSGEIKEFKFKQITKY